MQLHHYLFVVIQSIIDDLRKFIIQLRSCYKIPSTVVFLAGGRRCLRHNHNVTNIIIVQFIIRFIRPEIRTKMMLIRPNSSQYSKPEAMECVCPRLLQEECISKLIPCHCLPNLPVFVVLKFSHGDKFLVEFKI